MRQTMHNFTAIFEAEALGELCGLLYRRWVRAEAIPGGYLRSHKGSLLDHRPTERAQESLIQAPDHRCPYR